MAPAKRSPDQPPAKGVKEPEVAFLLEGIPVVKFRPEDYVPKVVRPQWATSTDFIVVCLAFAIGLGNIQFAYLAHKNGGSVFFIPYFLALIVIAIPMVVLEIVLGHLMQRGCLTAWNLTPILSGVGIASAIMLIYRNAYYIIVSLWAAFYSFHTLFSSEIPWRSYCLNSWNTAICEIWNKTTVCVTANQTLRYLLESKYPDRNVTELEQLFPEIDPSRVFEKLNICELLRYPAEQYFTHFLQVAKDFTTIRLLSLEFLIGLSVVYGIICISVMFHIRVLGKFIYLLFITPYAIMVAMLLRSFGLPGAFTGIWDFYLKPDLQKLFTFKIWIDAVENILYTFGPGLGVYIALGSYNRNNVKIVRQTCLVCIISALTSFLIGVMIFAYIGHAAYHDSDADAFWYYKRLITDDLSLIFVAVPSALLMLNWSTVFWTFLFFLMVVLFGLSTQVVAVEALITALLDRSTCCNCILKRFVVSIFVCAFLFGTSSIFVTDIGMHIYRIFRSYSATSYAALFTCVVECIVIAWIFGPKAFADQTKFYLLYSPSIIWRIFWIFITPAALLATLVIEALNHPNFVYDSKFEFPFWIWIIVGSSVVWILIYIFIDFCCNRQCTKERIFADTNIRRGHAYEAVPTITFNEDVVKSPKSPPKPNQTRIS